MVPVPVPQRQRPARRAPRAVRALLGAGQLTLLLAAVGVVCAHFTIGLGLQTVLSDSMRPTFAAGDHLVVVDRSPGSLQVGDIPVLTFSDGDLRAHRIVAVEQGRGVVRLQTRGDANSSADSWTDVDSERAVPVAVTALPALPSVITSALRGIHLNPVPSAVLLGLGGLGITCWAMRRQYLLMRSCTCQECTDRRSARTTTRSTKARTTTPRLDSVEQREIQEIR